MSCASSVFESYDCPEETCGGCLALCQCISDCDYCTSTRCYCGQRYFLSLAIFFTSVMLLSCICFLFREFPKSCTVSTLIVLLNLIIASALCMLLLEPWDVKYEVIWGTTFLTLACTSGVCISYFCYPNFATPEDEFEFSPETPTKPEPPKKKKSRESVLIKIVPRRLRSSEKRSSKELSKSLEIRDSTSGRIQRNMKPVMSPDSAGRASHSDSESTTSFSDNEMYGLPEDHPAFFSQGSYENALLSADAMRKSINLGLSWGEEGSKEGCGKILAPTSNGSNCEIVPL